MAREEPTGIKISDFVGCTDEEYYAGAQICKDFLKELENRCEFNDSEVIAMLMGIQGPEGLRVALAMQTGRAIQHRVEESDSIASLLHGLARGDDDD